jgi:hypothetical protein
MTQDGLVLASEVEPGQMMLVLTEDNSETTWMPCQANRHAVSYSYKLTSENGAELICSETTPITLRDGSYTYPQHVDGHELPIWTNDKLEWQKCWAEPIGFADVQRISVHSRIYAAGMDPTGDLIFTHNLVNQAKP